MSLLRANGHPEAWRYPLGRLQDECLLVTQRINANLALEAVLIQAAVSATPNGFVDKSTAKKMNENFTGWLKRLTGG